MKTESLLIRKTSR